MTEHQRALFETAAEALQTARRNLDAGDAELSVAVVRGVAGWESALPLVQPL